MKTMMQKNIKVNFLLACSIISFAIGDQCKTPDGKDGDCKHIRECLELDYLFKNLKSAEDYNYLEQSKCGSSKFGVCCPVNTQITSKNSISIAYTTPSPPDTTTSYQYPNTATLPSKLPPNNFILPCKKQPKTICGPQTKSRPPGKLPESGTCGIQKSQRRNFEDQAAITEFPWLALIEYTKPNDEKDFHCAGTLINENYVLTAAHCVTGNDITLWEWRLSGVRLGEWNTTSDADCENDICSEPVQNIRVKEHIIHEGYDPQTKEQRDDIALLRLEQSVSYTDWIQPICLPASQDINKSYDMQPLIVPGWGKSETVSGSSLKMLAEINGVPHEQCNNLYREYNVTLTDKVLCAGGQMENDLCQVDSGGPLLMQQLHNETQVYYTLEGIVSFGRLPCGESGWPSIYTRIDQYMDWIRDNVKA